MTAFADQLRELLNGTTPGRWQRTGTGHVCIDIVAVEEDDQMRRCVAEVQNARDVDLIAAAPELLAEALRRCDPGDTDINALVEHLRLAAMDHENGHGFDGHVFALRLAADLIEQAFGDPQ